MAQPVGPWPWLTVGKLKELFVQFDCEFRELDALLYGPGCNGEKITFLYSPLTDDFVSLNGYADDERIPWSEVENWERRLGVKIPRGPGH